MSRKTGGAVGALGLGGYASDDSEGSGSQEMEAEEMAEEQQPNQLPGSAKLLPHYHSRESLDMEEAEGWADLAQDEERRQSTAAAETSGVATEGDTEGRQGFSGRAPGDPLLRLPPELRDPLPTTCSEQLQAKFAQYLHSLKTKGISLTDQISHRKAFRNPDFLQKLVDHFNVSQHGSAFPPDVFSPEALPQEDTIEQLLRALEREQERRARLREQQTAAGTARIDFAKGAGPLGHLPASSSGSNLAAAQAAALAQAAVARVVGSRR